MMAELKVSGITFAYEEAPILENVNIELHEHELVSILGASGCGKTTLFHIISGLHKPQQGKVVLNGKDITGCPGQISYMMQKDLLLPYRTIEDNVSLPLVLKGEKKRKAREKVSLYFEEFGLEGTQKKYPRQLSGGMRQRAALLRTYMFSRDVALLDEPFSALDVFLKDQLQQELQEMLEDYPGIVILVSHSRDEIYRFCEELVIAGGGKKIIQGRTKDIFTQPVYKEAARLTGCKNFSKIRICNAHTVEASDWGITLHFQNAVPADAVSIGFRAHDFVPVWGNRTGNSIRFHAVERAELPFEYHYYFMPENGREDETHKICWFVQRGELAGLEQRGMPDYLRLPENKIMFLKD